MVIGKYVIKFKFPIEITTDRGNEWICWNWKYKMKKALRQGKLLTALKYLKVNNDMSLKEAKYLIDTKYKPKYYRHNGTH